MKATDFLSRAYYLDQQINSKLDQMKLLHSLATRVTSVMNQDPVSHTRNVTAREDAIACFIDAENALSEEIASLFSLRDEISSVISLVRSERYRLILEKRYLSFMAWEDIGHDLNISARWAQIKHQEALGVVQGILDAKEKAESPPEPRYEYHAPLPSL